MAYTNDVAMPLLVREGRSTAMVQRTSSTSARSALDHDMMSLQHATRANQSPDIVLRDGKTSPSTCLLGFFSNSALVSESAKDISRVPRALSAPAKLPMNFASVLPGIYRSSYPQVQDYGFLKSLKLRTIVTLVEKELPEGFKAFMDTNKIKHQIFAMEGTKKADIPLSTMQSIMAFILDRRNQPLLIHCNHGKHRTGCVVGVVRKFNGWSTANILAEYTKYAEPKVRETDVRYLENFQQAHLRPIVARQAARQVARPGMSIGQFLILIIFSTIVLLIWLLSGQRLLDDTDVDAQFLRRRAPKRRET